MDLKCRNSKKLNLLTDLLRHCDEEPIRQQDFMELLSCMMQRGFHVRTPKNYILLEFFIALRSPDFKEEISPITVAIVKMLLEAQDAKAKKNEEAMSLRQAKRHSACFDPYVLFLEQFKKNPNRSGTEVLRLFLDNGYFNKKKALCYVFSFKTYKACFHSMEKLESILIASRLLRKRVSKVNKCSDATDDCFWTIPNTFYSPSAKPISSILDFVGCISKLHFSCVFEPQPLRYALFATCKKCVEKTLPDIIRAICARDSSIITFTEMRLRDNALLLLSYNPLRRHRATYEAVSVLIEFGIDVGYVNYVGYNGLIMFLINDDSSESCCEYGNWLEPKDYSYWDTLTLLVGAGCKIDLCKKFGKGMLYKALSKLSFNSVCAKCARGKLIDASSRRECFDHFSKFFAQLLTFGLNFDADTKCDTMNIALHACESYKGDEKTALKKLVSKLDVTSNIKCDDS